MEHLLAKADRRKTALHFLLLLFFLMFFLLLSSCTVRHPKGILGKSKLENVLYDFQVARAIAMQSGDSTDFRALAYTDAVLYRYGITREEFNASMLWYAQHTEELYAIYGNIQKRLEKESAALGNSGNLASSYAQLSSKGDTANVWKGRSFYLLTSKGMDNRFCFSLNADTSYQAGDRLVWHFVSQFVFSSGSRDATVSMSVWYDNDSVSSVTQRLYSDGDFSLEITAASGHKIKKITGFVYLNAPWSEEQKLLVVRQPSLIRYHKLVVVERPSNKTDSLKVATDSSLRAQPASGANDTVSSHARSSKSPTMRREPVPVMKHQTFFNK